MKIGNEYVEIKAGNKTYRKENMLLDIYLKKIFAQQLNVKYDGANINACYIKLDTPLENIDYDSNLLGTDFDIRILGSGTSLRKSFIGNKKMARITYNFDNQTYFYKENDTWIGTSAGNFDMFSGKKIVGIGFGNANQCYTYLDTSNMNININLGEKFKFTRVDKIISDGEVEGLEYPLHLANGIADKDGVWKLIQEGREYSVYETTNAQLYSIGFGNTKGVMEEEYLIEDVEVDRDDTSITFELSRTKSEGIYPSDNLQLGFTPIKDNSKYLIFKYRLYRRYFDEFYDDYLVTYLNEYYTMNRLNDNFGNLEIKIKIER